MTGRAGSGVLGAETASLVGVVAIVADEVLALVGEVLDEFGQEVQGLEELVVAGDAAEEVFTGGLGVSSVVACRAAQAGRSSLAGWGYR